MVSATPKKKKNEKTYTMERVWDRRIEDGTTKYLTSWVNSSKKTWEPEAHFVGELAKEIVRELNVILDDPANNPKPNWLLKFEKQMADGIDVMNHGIDYVPRTKGKSPARTPVAKKKQANLMPRPNNPTPRRASIGGTPSRKGPTPSRKREYSDSDESYEEDSPSPEKRSRKSAVNTPRRSNIMIENTPKTAPARGSLAKRAEGQKSGTPQPSTTLLQQRSMSTATSLSGRTGPPSQTSRSKKADSPQPSTSRAPNTTRIAPRTPASTARAGNVTKTIRDDAGSFPESSTSRGVSKKREELPPRAPSSAAIFGNRNAKKKEEKLSAPTTTRGANPPANPLKTRPTESTDAVAAKKAEEEEKNNAADRKMENKVEPIQAVALSSDASEIPGGDLSAKNVAPSQPLAPLQEMNDEELVKIDAERAGTPVHIISLITEAAASLPTKKNQRILRLTSRPPAEAEKSDAAKFAEKTMTTTQLVHMDITKGSQLPAEDVNGSEGKAAGTRKESVEATAVVPPEAAENSAPIPPIASRSDASSDASTSEQNAERKRQKKELVRRERERIQRIEQEEEENEYRARRERENAVETAKPKAQWEEEQRKARMYVEGRIKKETDSAIGSGMDRLYEMIQGTFSKAEEMTRTAHTLFEERMTMLINDQQKIIADNFDTIKKAHESLVDNQMKMMKDQELIGKRIATIEEEMKVFRKSFESLEKNEENERSTNADLARKMDEMSYEIIELRKLFSKSERSQGNQASDEVINIEKVEARSADANLLNKKNEDIREVTTAQANEANGEEGKAKPQLKPRRQLLTNREILQMIRGQATKSNGSAIGEAEPSKTE